MGAVHSYQWAALQSRTDGAQNILATPTLAPSHTAMQGAVMGGGTRVGSTAPALKIFARSQSLELSYNKVTKMAPTLGCLCLRES